MQLIETISTTAGSEIETSCAPKVLYRTFGAQDVFGTNLGAEEP